jgi:hypothetical protein
MAITAKFYPSAAAKMFNNDLNDGDSFKMALLSSAGTYDSTDVLYSDVSANQISGTGYSSGGVAVTVGPATSDASKAEFPVTAALWTGATFTFQNAVIYQVASGALLMHLAFDAEQDVAGQDYQINAPSPAPKATPVV